MAKGIIFTRLTVFDNDFNMYSGVKELFVNLNKEGHKLIVISHSPDSLDTMEGIFKQFFDFKVNCIFRKKIRENVGEKNASKFVLVGSSDEDLILAANKKILIINPGWSIKQDDLPARYGITLKKADQLYEAIRLIDNQNRWYYKLNVDEKATVLALTSANTMNRDVEESEKEVLEGFEKSLKSGDRSYFNTLYFHLISGVMKSQDLRKVGLWGIFPSSSGEINKEVEELKERCRYLTGKKMDKPLFLRHVHVSKSHHTSHEVRLKEGCIKHFESIVINPYYSGKIKGKVVCVIDDYVTNGTSFETARNLLLKAGASKVILVALGRFKRGSHGIYQQEVYDLTGNLSKPGYKYNLKYKKKLNKGVYDIHAREEIRRIYDILKG
ncbi:phosphoribosyltransferase [Bacillus velezensis]|uniref:phosphoribosyltransferase n=1 Tax=Bacillus velezensis TaxID=492670 RepID=UPI0010FC2D1A|nr:phosphoribosyltransferase [Bacillus velezensis]QCT28789.1 phosphoribosyltransferase [Bacillus velezensis]